MKTSAAAFILFALVLALPARAASAGNPEIAALQVGLRGQGAYAGTVDGVLGAETVAAVRRFQQNAGLVADGVPGPRTRAALGPSAAWHADARSRGPRGDAAALQFALAWHGCPSGRFDGRLGARTDSALRSFQAWAGLKPDGRAGRSKFAALRGALPRALIALSAPLQALRGDGFGPRGARFHTGLDFIAPGRAPVAAAAAGRVVFAKLDAGSWGNFVVLGHGSAVHTLYGHLSRIDVRLGQRIAAGGRVGLVGATGNATGPHLHFEVRLRGAAVDPATALQSTLPGRPARPSRVFRL